VVAQIGHIDIPGGIHRHTVRGIKLRATGAAAIAAESRHARAGDRIDRAPGYLAHAVIVGVGDIKVAETIDGNSLDVGEFGSQWRSAVADDRTARDGLDPIGYTPIAGSPRQGNACEQRQDGPVVLHP
jgi:hypothetical protein